MKRLMVILLCMGMGVVLSAQHETLFGRARLSGAFGAPIAEIGLGNDLMTAGGGGGGIVFSDFFIGAYGVAAADFDRLFDDDLDYLDMAHGGLWLGFTPKTYSLVHLYTSARIGWGAVDIDLRDNGVRYRDLDKIFVLTPEIGLELNVTKWFRLGGTVGYRWVRGIEDNSFIANDDFSGGITTLSFRFGWFGNKRY